MLNPSTADARDDDPTVRRCIAFARSWGFDAVQVVNLFALRATDPRRLRGHPRPIGRQNDRWILQAHRASALTVLAWGNHGALGARSQEVLELLRAAGGALHILGLTSRAQPRHPLYVAGATVPLRWDELAGAPLHPRGRSGGQVASPSGAGRG